MNAAPPSPAPPGAARRLGRWLRSGLVFLIVTAHLFFFVVRNPLDLWEKNIYAWMKDQSWWDRWGKTIERVDRATYKFANLAGCEQRWVMFSPPMARGASFLGFRLEFTDGSHVTIRSDGEPTPERYFRFGEWQIRKFEEHLVYPPDDLARDEELPLWEAYARDMIRRWYRDHPDDKRTLKRLVMVRRRITFTTPDDLPGVYAPPAERDIAAFDAEGRLLP
jgi:hypothetical protein